MLGTFQKQSHWACSTIQGGGRCFHRWGNWVTGRLNDKDKLKWVKKVTSSGSKAWALSQCTSPLFSWGDMFSKSGMTLRDCPNLLLKFSLSGTFLSYPFLYPTALWEKRSVFGYLTFPHSHSRGWYVREPITGVSAVFSIICVALQLYKCTIIIIKKTTTWIYYKRLSDNHSFIQALSPSWVWAEITSPI